MKIAQRHWVMALSIAALSTAALAAPFAYVPNEKSGTLSVIDTETDAVVAEIEAGREGVATASYDLDAIAKNRAAFGFFRDRRTDLYGALAGPRPA